MWLHSFYLGSLCYSVFQFERFIQTTINRDVNGEASMSMFQSWGYWKVDRNNENGTLRKEQDTVSWVPGIWWRNCVLPRCHDWSQAHLPTQGDIFQCVKKDRLNSGYYANTKIRHQTLRHLLLRTRNSVSYYVYTKVKSKRKSNAIWVTGLGGLGLWDVQNLTLSRQSAHS
jgi:hypothetical protein